MSSLIKTQLNINFGISALKYRFTKEKKRRWETILIALAILMGVGPLLTLYIFMMTGIFVAGTSIGKPELVLTLAFISSQMVVLVFGLFYIIGSFYFSQDMSNLAPLPLRPYEVVGSKFIVVMVNEYITAIPIIFPPLLIYGLGTGQGLFYWIKGIIMMLAAPVIPLTISTVFIMLLMRVVNLKKNKDLLAIIGGFAGVLLALSINFFVQRTPKTGGKDFFKNFLESKSDLIQEIGRKFPSGIWATYGLKEDSLAAFGYFLLFMGVSAGFFAALLWLGNLVFYKALLAGQEVTRKRKTAGAHDLERQYDRISSPVTAIIKREWKLLLRTPVYVINSLTGALIGPFILLVVMFTQGSDAETLELMKALRNPEFAPYVALGGLALILFTAGMNLAASTSVSREGKTLWILKMIPVPAKQQVLAKLVQSYMVSVIGILTTGIVLGLALKISMVRLLAVILLGLLGSVPMVTANLLLDVFHPKLIWNSEQEAMKQNLNGGLGMLLSVIILAVLAIIAIVLILLHVNEWIIFAGLGAVSIILSALLLPALFALADRKYRDYEV